MEGVILAAMRVGSTSLFIAGQIVVGTIIDAANGKISDFEVTLLVA